MSKHGKKYLDSLKKIEVGKFYTPEEAAKLVKDTAYAKFDSSIEVHLRLGIDPRKSDQLVRGTVSLPRGTGKTVRVLVVADGEGQKIAEEAGADFVGLDDIVEKIQGGWFDFDVAVATPQTMGKIGRLGRVLGPRGLMPSPKAGTVVQPNDLGRVIKELKGGRVEFKLDRTANIHVTIGKSSFDADAILENFTALMEAIVTAKPAAAKGQYIHTVTMAATMGPGIKVDVAQASQLKSI